MTSKPQSVELNTGAMMPLMGFGTFMGDLNPDHEKTVETFTLAMETGFRHFDCAKLYGTEKMLGEALNQQFKEGRLKREDVFVTTKLWPNSARQESVVPSLKTQLADLGLDYVDLYLVHWPLAVKPGPDLFPTDDKGNTIFDSTDYLDTWKGMEECYNLGLAKAIGISNFNSMQIARILENCAIKPASLQVESHPLFNNNRLIQFCQERGICVTAYAPLAGNDPAYSAGKGTWPTIFQNEIIETIAQKHNVTPAQVALRYQTQRNVAVIPKTSNRERMKENVQSLNVDLTAEDIAEIDSCDKGYRQCIVFEDHPNHPFKEDF